MGKDNSTTTTTNTNCILLIFYITLKLFMEH